MTTFGGGAVTKRTYFSAHHLFAAKHFASLAQAIEDSHSGKPIFNVEHRAYAINAVLSSAYFLEAAINEIGDDVSDGHPGYVDSLSSQTKQTIKTDWEDTEKKPVLQRFQRVLRAAGQPTFDENKRLFQDTFLLIRLRNLLVHSRAVTRGSSELNPLESLLKPKFARSRLTHNSADPFFPDQCLGAGCANWASASAQTFADEFFRLLKLVPNYQRQ